MGIQLIVANHLEGHKVILCFSRQDAAGRVSTYAGGCLTNAVCVRFVDGTKGGFDRFQAVE